MSSEQRSSPCSCCTMRPASSPSYSEGQHRVSPQWLRAVSMEAHRTTPLHLGQILYKRKREPVLAQKLCLPLHRATVRACMERDGEDLTQGKKRSMLMRNLFLRVCGSQRLKPTLIHEYKPRK